MPKILIVDDDTTTLLVFKAHLSKAGYQTETAVDGLDALEKLPLFKPDLVLLDINMPKLSGFEVAKRMKEDPAMASIPIFMLTSLKQEANIKRGYELGVEEYITKPANIEHLKLRLAKALGGK